MIIMPKEDNGNGKVQKGCNILSADELANGKTTEIEGLEISGQVRNLSPCLWTNAFKDITRLVVQKNQLTRVPPEITSLKCLVHLDLSHNMLRSLPPEIGDLVTLRELLLKHNYLRVLPLELGKLFQLQSLNLDENPMSPDIGQMYKDPRSSVAKILTYMLDKLPVPQISPPSREWKNLNDIDNAASSYVFTIMTYNILAETYASRQHYGYCPSWALNWQHRKKTILREILSHTADIVCLQEVVMEEYSSFFLPELTKDGYEGIFSPKSRAKTMHHEEAKFVDGCAIFYKTSKFSFVKEQLVEFNQLAMEKANNVSAANGSSKASEDLLNRVMTKDNIGVVAVLEFKNPPENHSGSSDSHRIMIANLHIHWDPEYCDVKLMQILLFVTELRKISDHMPMVLTGDFNSLPSSGVVRFLLDGRIPYNHPDFKDIEYKHVFKGIRGNLEGLENGASDHGEMTHPYNLSSAYEHHSGSYTNYTYEFKGVIDYIFYPNNCMKPLGILDTIPENWFRENKIIGCPHPAVPSDHFLLLTELQMFVPPSSIDSANGGAAPGSANSSSSSGCNNNSNGDSTTNSSRK